MSAPLTHARRGLAGLAGLALLGGALVVTAAPSSAEPVAATEASATWGLRASFTNYVSGSGGSVTVAEGATRSPDFGWPGAGAGDYDLATRAGSIPLAGKVTYVKTSTFINELTFANPTVVFDGEGGGRILADITYDYYGDGSGQPAKTGDEDQVPLATLHDVPAPVTATVGGSTSVTYTAVPTALTTEGSVAYEGFYDEGAALEPLTISFVADGVLPTSSATPTGSTTTTPTAPAAKVASTTTLSVAKKQLKKLKAGKKGKVTVRVAATGATPTGEVTVRDKKKRLKTAALANGKVKLKLKKLKRGKKHVLRAVYAGDASTLGSTSAKVVVKVKKAKKR